jgi:2-oxo-hept-3-ene-1,7-dioate hydratase
VELAHSARAAQQGRVKAAAPAVLTEGLLYKNGVVEETGLASGVMGHPAMGIAWLANKVGPHGVTLEPGHLMLSGSFTRPIWVVAGDTV